MRSRLGMFAYYQKKRRVGGRTSHLARGDRVPIHLLTYLQSFTGPHSIRLLAKYLYQV